MELSNSVFPSKQFVNFYSYPQNKKRLDNPEVGTTRFFFSGPIRELRLQKKPPPPKSEEMA